MDQIITKQYKDLLQTLHSESESFGKTGSNISLVHKFLLDYDIRQVMDYGCGKGASWTFLEGVVNRLSRYDPGVPQFDNPNKEPMQGLFCIDVMEHVEEECLDAVLRHIHSLTGEYAMFYISLQPSKDILPDGRNAHINLKGPSSWVYRLGKYFHLVEATTRVTSRKTGLYYVGTPKAIEKRTSKT